MVQIGDVAVYTPRRGGAVEVVVDSFTERRVRVVRRNGLSFHMSNVSPTNLQTLRAGLLGEDHQCRPTTESTTAGAAG